MRCLSLILLACLPACSPAEEEQTSLPLSGSDDLESYQPSPTQIRVDQSFSSFIIDTPLSEIEQLLSPLVQGECLEYGECEWRDDEGVRHYFFRFSDDDHLLVVKSVSTEDFVDRPISALGIGMARKREDVLANVRAFLPEIELNCDPENVSGNVGPDECGATLNPGWFQIGFDADGKLRAIRFDGYHFT